MENRKLDHAGTQAATAAAAAATTTNNSGNTNALTTASAATPMVAGVNVTTGPATAVNNNNNSSGSSNPPTTTTTGSAAAIAASTNSCVALVPVSTLPTGAAVTTAATATSAIIGATTAPSPAATTTAHAATAPPSSSSSPSTHTPPAQQHHHHHHHHGHGHHSHSGSISGQGSSSSMNSSSFAPMSSLSSSSSSGSSSTRTRPAVFDKLEQLVRDMQDDDRGVPVRSQKMFLTSIPAAFMGYDLIEWLMDRLSIEDSLEAVHLANLLCQFGYYFPINELKNLLVKDDSSLYRFQTPYYWPSQHHTPDNIEYAIYLDKRSQRNRQKHGLEDYELDAYNNLKKILANKWEFVMMQADEQLKIAKDRKKGEKIVTDSQEKAYWRVYRPPPGYTTVVESSPVPTREQRSKARSRTREHLTDEYEFLKSYLAMSRSKVSQVSESLIDYTDTFVEFDPVLNPVIPSNPWVADESSYWLLNQPIVDSPTEKRVRKWAISLEDLIIDPLGLQELMSYMKKEYSHENLRFWLAVQELRRGPGSEAVIKKHVKEIWDEFLAPGAKAEINIDAQTMDLTKHNMKTPTRYTFEEAAGHIYLLLLKKDCYPRFIRSEHYKSLLANALKPRNMKKPFFNFPARKKPTSTPAVAGPGGPGPGHVVNSKERMWGGEDCAIYGAQGGDNSDSPETNTFDRNMCRDINDSVCPWDTFGGDSKKSPRGSVGSGGGAGSHKRRGSDPAISTTSRCTAGGGSGGGSGGPGGASHPSEGGTSPHHGKHRSHHQSALCGEGKACSGATAKSCSATRTSSLENSLERTGSCRRRQTDGRGSLPEDGSGSGGGHHHHHHHHHHGHGSGMSRRSKNRSKRKKTSVRSSTLTSAGELAAAIAAAAAASTAVSTTTTTSTQFNAPSPAATAVVAAAAAVQVGDHGGGGSGGGGGGGRVYHQHGPPMHQHSTSSLLSSIVAPASVLMVAQSFDRGMSGSAVDDITSGIVGTLPLLPQPTVLSASTTTASTTTTSSKCTQTKLEDDDELFNIPTSPTLAKQSPVRATTHLSSSSAVKKDQLVNARSQTKSLTAGDSSDQDCSSSVPVNRPESGSVSQKSQQTRASDLVDPGPADSTAIRSGADAQVAAGEAAASSQGSSTAAAAAPTDEAGGATTTTTSSECKGDIGTWASSTEVCPWEDEENRRDSHPPFVKTYATLGFL